MLTLAEYAARDAVGLAELIKQGEVTAAEVHTIAVSAIAAVNKVLNAVSEGPWESPLEYRSDSVFAGVPFVLKDILCHPSGVPMHFGCRALSDGIVYDHDSYLMSRFRNAGLALVATTRTPELALNANTEPLLGGSTRNPWDPSKSPGGSSGGTAALVAAGAVPLGHANDGGGSIRIPAARTGLVGLKPSRGRVPLGPDQQDVMFGNGIEFAVTRSVRDCATLLDSVSGNAPGEKFSAPPPERPYREEVATSRGPLRIAVCTDGWSGREVDPRVLSVVEDTANLLRELGHTVDYARPEFSWEELLEAFTTTWCAGTASTVAALTEALGSGPNRQQFEATTITCADAGLRITPVQLGRAFDTVNTVSRTVAAFMAEWDLLLTPTAITTSQDLGALDSDNTTDSAQEWVRKVLSDFPFCAMYNQTGAPAINVPIGQSDGGLPIGIQLGADVYQESLLLGVAAQLEIARPWHDRLPAVHVASVTSRKLCNTINANGGFPG